MDRIFTGDASFKGLVVRLAAGLAFGSGRNLNPDATIRRLLILARQARVSRDIEALDAISNVVLGYFNDSPYAEVARFHKAHCLQARGDASEGRKLLTEVVGRAGSKFRARGLLALGTSYFEVGEYSESLSLYLQAIRAADEADPLTNLQSMRSVAIVRGIKGDHSGSLSALEALLPQTLYLSRWYPADLYDHLNSTAVEMGDLGRVDEALRIIDRVLGSGLTRNFPKWFDTKVELATKPRLVFPPFTIALGAPADLGLQNQSEARLDPVQKQAEREPDSMTAVSGASRERIPAVVPCRLRIADLMAAPPVISFARQPEKDAHGSTPHPTNANRGYAISPPARAPPTNH